MSGPTLHTNVESPTHSALLHTLLYFELFDYPLTAEEVFSYLYFPPDAIIPAISAGETAQQLDELVRQGRVFRFGDFYQTNNNPDWVVRRLDNNRRAAAYLPLARHIARFIGAFPFIRGVFVSGSLSKSCMKPDSDLDFFLITAPGRLWLARTLLVLFKKIFLFNSHKYFCVNYFIDTEHLEIEEKNLFTATETVTLLPLYGREWYQGFCMANAWAWERYPHLRPRPAGEARQHRRGFLKRGLEWLLNGRLGAWLDLRTMRSTVRYWRHKFSHFDQKTFDSALKSRRYVSKHHPLYFQQKVLEGFNKRVREMA